MRHNPRNLERPGRGDPATRFVGFGEAFSDPIRHGCSRPNCVGRWVLVSWALETLRSFVAHNNGRDYSLPCQARITSAPVGMRYCAAEHSQISIEYATGSAPNVSLAGVKAVREG